MDRIARKMMINEELEVLNENITIVESLSVTIESMKLLHVMEQVKGQLLIGPARLQDVLIQKLPLLYLQIRKLKLGEVS